MNGMDFILLINMTVSGLFCCSFLGIAAYARENAGASAPIFAASFFLAMLYFLTEIVIPPASSPHFGYLLGFITHFAGLVCLAVGLARMYSAPVPWGLVALLSGISMALIYDAYGMPRNRPSGMLLYQMPDFLMMGLAVWVILRERKQGMIDMLMVATFSVCAMHVLLRPVLTTLSADSSQSVYALLSQSVDAFFMVSSGLMLLLSLMREALSNVMARSETDQLSGLLNRRGFEFRAEAAIEKSKRMRQALSLVVCDIDNFKSINDTHGHMLGDRVIEALATELRRGAIAKGGLAARMGGEEFVVLLPGNTVQSAWRFAEEVRLACACIRIPGSAGHIVFTASFGITEMEFSDTFADVYKRADGALYEAKKSGRNCVRSVLPVFSGEDAAKFPEPVA